MEALYNVYFAGQLQEGQQLATVRAKLAKLFNADDATLEKLFCGKPQLLKRDCDKATALKYKKAMENAGAKPVIQRAESAVTSTAEVSTAKPAMTAAERIAALAAAPDLSQQADSQPAAPSSTSPSSASPPEQVAPAADGDIDLAPVGTDVLLESERSTPTQADIDTSALEVDAAAVRLSPEPEAAPAAPDTSHLDMGAVGDKIPTLPSDQTPLSPNIEGISLSPEGADFSDCAAPEVGEPQLDLSAMDLAPAGSEVLEAKYRQADQVEAPSTDHLSLES